MTWADLLTNGLGQTEYRLKIEGCSTEWVTAAALERAGDLTANTTRYVRGLQRDGLAIKEEADLVRAKLKLSGFTARIVDWGEYATREFALGAENTTYLTADCDVGDGTVTAPTWTGFAVNDLIHIDTECMRITNIAGTIASVARAQLGTTEQKHWTADGATLRLPEINDRPVCIEGRRVWLYAYSDEPDLAGSGTQIFLGMVSSEPRLSDDSTTWEIGIDPITRILSNDLGFDANQQMTPRGIYYPYNRPCIFNLRYFISLAPGYYRVNLTDIKIDGFFATQEEFCAEAETQINAAYAPLSGDPFTIHLVPVGDGYNIIANTDDLTVAPSIKIISDVDFPEGEESFVQFRDPADGEVVDGLFASTSKEYVGFVSARVPRGIFGQAGSVPAAGSPDRGIQDDSFSVPSDKIYLAGDVALSAVAGISTHLRVSWEDGTGVLYSILGINGTTNAFTLEESGAQNLIRVFGTGGETTATLSIDFGSATGDTLDVYLQGIIDNSATYANIGVLPFLTSNDIDMTTSAANIQAAALSNPIVANRVYSKISSGKFEDWLAEELKLLGCFIATDSIGRLVIKQLIPPSPVDALSVEINPSNTLADNGMPTWQRSSFGLINSVVFETGYDLVKDSWGGQKITTRDVPGFGTNKITRQIEIKPKSTVAGGDQTVSLLDWERIAQNIYSMFGTPYRVIGIEVPMNVFTGTLIGDTVTLVNNHLPDDLTGYRGFTAAKACLVTGRNWDLQKGRGSLTLFVPQTRTTGYTPTMFTTGAGDGVIVDFTLTVTDLDPYEGQSVWPAGATLTDMFAVGDRIRAHSWDSTAPVTNVATITAINSATEIEVTFDAPWEATGDVVLSYCNSTMQDSQKLFGFLADTSFRIDFGTTVPAYVFA